MPIQRLNLRPARDLPGLLACWSPIDTNGDDSLYRKMFVNPAVEGQDAAAGEFFHLDVLELGDHVAADVELEGDDAFEGPALGVVVEVSEVGHLPSIIKAVVVFIHDRDALNV